MLYDFEANYKRYGNKNISIGMLKYILFLIVIINSVVSLIFERIIVKFLERFWRKNTIKKYRKDIKKINDMNLLNENEYYEEPLYKYQDVYFYDRRFGENYGIKNKSDKKVDGKKFIELVVSNENDNNIDNGNN